MLKTGHGRFVERPLAIGGAIDAYPNRPLTEIAVDRSVDRPPCPIACNSIRQRRRPVLMKKCRDAFQNPAVAVFFQAAKIVPRSIESSPKNRTCLHQYLPDSPHWR